MVVQDMLRQYASPFAAEGKVGTLVPRKYDCFLLAFNIQQELAIAELARPVDLQGVLNLR